MTKRISASFLLQIAALMAALAMAQLQSVNAKTISPPVASSIPADPSIAGPPIQPDRLAPTPPMGWAGWNRYFCDYDEKTVRDQADAMVASGMRDMGYKYVLVQECIAPGRNADGLLVVDPVRFPHGFKALVDYIHSRGLKAGIYTDIGPHTCAGPTPYEGSYQHEDMDAALFAQWGVDLIEMDYCNKPPGTTGREIYERMSKSIQKTGRPMLFYVCSAGAERPWEWGPGVAGLWRTDRDISPSKNKAVWDLIVQNFEANARYGVFNSPRGWNDADMLEVGNSGLTANEASSQFLMWAVSAAPLWASTDLAHMSGQTGAILTNKEVIAVDQDPLGAAATKVQEDTAGLEVWAKPLGSKASGVQAVLLLNLTSRQEPMRVSWANLGLEPQAAVRDLQSHQDLGTFPERYETLVPAHGAAILKVAGTFSWRKGATYEAEWPANLRRGPTELHACSECSAGYSISLFGVNATSPSSIDFTHIGVSTPGEYTLILGYLHVPYPSTGIDIQINKAPPMHIDLVARVIGRISIPVILDQRENVIRISNGSRNRVDVDMIHLARTP